MMMNKSQEKGKKNNKKMDFLISAFFLFFLLCSYQVFRTFFAKSRASFPSRLPPGPPPLPIIGNLLSLGRLPQRSFHQLSLTYGPIIRLSLGRITAIVVSSPSLVREILQTHDSCFYDRFILDTFTACSHDQYGLPFVPVSPLFKTLRKIYNTHIFAARKLDGNQHLRVEQVQRLIHDVARCAVEGRAVDVGESTFCLILNQLSSTLFSVNLTDSSTSSRVGELMEVMRNIMAEAGHPNIADFFPVLKRWDPQGLRRLLESYSRVLFDIFDEIIEKRTVERAERGKPGRDDVLETLLDICQDEDSVDLVLIKHLFLDTFLAGIDATSNGLEWAMTELLHNPGKMAKAQSELHEMIGRGMLVGENDIPRLSYLQAIIKETFRLHPPTPLLLPRMAREEKMVGGYIIPKGTVVLVNIWGMGRDSSVWGETVNEFMPERFLGRDTDVKGQHFELVPFGGGRRICPGLPLATRMLHVTLGSLLNNFNWKFEDGVAGDSASMDERFGITLRKARPLKAVPLIMD